MHTFLSMDFLCGLNSSLKQTKILCYMAILCYNIISQYCYTIMLQYYVTWQEGEQQISWNCCEQHSGQHIFINTYINTDTRQGDSSVRKFCWTHHRAIFEEPMAQLIWRSTGTHVTGGKHVTGVRVSCFNEFYESGKHSRRLFTNCERNIFIRLPKRLTNQNLLH